MSKFLVVMNRECEFCFCVKGKCTLVGNDVWVSCPGNLSMRPEFCPLIEVEEKDIKYMLVRPDRYKNKRIWVNAGP